MKKSFRQLALIFTIMFTAALMLTACGDDDEPSGGGNGGNGSSSSENALVGTWTMNYDNGGGYQSWTFNADGTGSISSTIDMDYSWANGSFVYTITSYSSSSKSGKFKYTFTSGKSSGNTYNKSFKIDGNYINIDGQTYHK